MFDESLVTIASTAPGQSKSSGQYEAREILAGLQERGFAVSRESLYAMLKGLGITKGPGGYYDDFDVVVLLNWLWKRDRYYSYSEFRELELAAIRTHFNSHKTHDQRDFNYAEQSW